jgi:four helix bundle protein
VDNWLTVLKDTGLVQSESASNLLEDNKEICKMLITMIKRIKGNKE